MYIAQREFVQAVDLVLKAQEFCQNHASESPNVREASVRLQEKIQHLINVLAGELSTEKSFQGGPRAGMYLLKFYSILLNFTQIFQLEMLFNYYVVSEDRPKLQIYFFITEQLSFCLPSSKLLYYNLPISRPIYW